MIRSLLPILAFVFAIPFASATGPAGGTDPVPTAQPSLAVRYLICLEGLYPSANGMVSAGDWYSTIGEIAVSTGYIVPANWHECDGALLSTSAYNALFTIIGYTYGGAGSQFALPDLRGRIPIGFDDAHPLGSVSGAGSATLTAAQLPSHAHSLGVGDSTGPAGGDATVDLSQPALALNFMIATEATFDYLAEVRLFAFGFESPQWKRCDGRLMNIFVNQALFSYLGDYYGGDARFTFGLPDLRGRTPIGVGNAPGLTPRSLGNKAGQTGLTLTPAQLPPHSHSITLGQTGSTGSGAPIDQMQPSLALTTVIVDEGVYPSFGGSDNYLVGFMLWRAGIDRIAGHLPADGTLLARPATDALRSLIGNTFGGAGAYFALPDARGRTILGANGPAPGTVAGSETLVLSATQMPVHTHTAGPGAETLAAEDIFARSASIRARVNPLGLATTAQFQYGTTSSYGTTVPIVLSDADGTTNEFPRLHLSGLTPQMIYHYRVTATNADGTTAGLDGTFQTRAEIPQDVDVTPTFADFAAVLLGARSSATEVIVANLGDFPLTLISIALTGGNGPADYQIEAFTLPPVLLPGEKVTLKVRFAPQSVGVHNSALRVITNDPDEGQVDVFLQGFGANRSPEVIAGMPLQVFRALSPQPFDVDLRGFFSDADGHPLTFQIIANSNPDIAVSLTGDVLSLSALGTASAQILLRAMDPYGAFVDALLPAASTLQNPPAQGTGWRGFSDHRWLGDGQWFQWESVQGHRYRIDWSLNLSSWQTLASGVVAGGGHTAWRDNAGAVRRFYRIAEDPAP